MIETAIALAVATVPEGLPIVATIALARGMQRMARRKALINRLSAVEALGATTVICTDKTGTLTENRMTVVQIALGDGEIQVSGEGLQTDGRFARDGESVDPEAQRNLYRLLQAGVLCNNAELRDGGGSDSAAAVGEPLEVALLVAGAKAGMRRDDLLESQPEVREIAFDPDTKMMATVHRVDGHYRIAVKGATAEVLASSARVLVGGSEQSLDGEGRDRWLDRNDEMAEEGLRVLALATGTAETAEVDPYQDLTFLGLAGLLDPPREEVRPALESCQAAGIRVVMVTGDHPVTAAKIAKAVGLASDGAVDTVQGSEFGSRDTRSEDERQRLVIGASLVPWLVGQLYRSWRSRERNGNASGLLERIDR